jgi:hypothetical protein
MPTLEEINDEIASLKAIIKAYENTWVQVTSSEEKLAYANLITASRADLTQLRLDKRTIEEANRGGGKLKDGIPLLQQNLTFSPPSVPSEKDHASCHRQIMDLPFVPSVPKEVLNAVNNIWRDAHIRESDGGKYLWYSSEDDIVFFIRRFLKDILLALNLRLDFNAEVTIKQIRPDLCVLLMGMYLVGVVEVKKPGNNVLLEPTVLGELMDQMLLVEGFYGMGPVIGILTTAEEWLVSWFPVDTDALALVDPPKASFTTPVKPKSSSTSTETKGYSPPGGTPSQQRGTIHSIDEVVDFSLELEDGVIQEMERVLSTTRVMNIYEDPICVLQHLCGAFQLMSKAHSHHTANLPRCLLKFHKGSHAVTFHPVSYDVVHSHVDFNKFPRSNVMTLVALEDLGRGSTGKAWLCVTVTQPCSACCVLKFDNKDKRSEKLVKERDMWHYLYPEFAKYVKVEHWSGADALVMPHFSTILESEREQYRDKIESTLTNHFMRNGKVHKDVRWRNIGKYRQESGEVAVVIYDLHDVVDYHVDAYQDWIENAVHSLYNENSITENK